MSAVKGYDMSHFWRLVSVDGGPGCGCSTNPARARYADGDPAGCYCTCSDDAREGCEHEPDEPQPTGLEVK